MRRVAQGRFDGSYEGRAATRFGRLGRLSLLALVVLVLTAVLATAVASAATVYRPTGETFAVPAPETSVNFGQIGVDNASGRILVTSTSGSGKVEVYAPSGDGATLEGSFGEGELSFPFNLAIDQDARVVYVGDPSGGQIRKYTISGTGPLTFTHDPTFTSPTAGAEPGQLGEVGGGPMAVDPTTGDLLVTDRFNLRVNRYTSSGAFVSSFNGEGAPGGAFGRPNSIAVDASGDIYVVNITQEDISFEYGKSFLQRFAPDGTPDTTFAPEIDTPRVVAVDEETGNVVVVGRSRGAFTHANGEGPYPIRLYTFNDDKLVEENDFPKGYEGAIASGIAVGAGRMYVATYATVFGTGFTGITPFDALEVPEPVLNEPTAVTTTTAQVSGTVDPLGKATVYHFEYSREGGPVQSTEEQELAAVTGPQPVSAELSDLLPNSEYSVRLVTGFKGGEATTRTQPRTLKTLPTAPRVVTGRAVDVGTTRTTLLGTVNPLGQQSTYYFEYGTTTAYGQRSPGTHNDVAGNSRDPQVAHGYLTGLQPGTTYHYRLVGVNATGVTHGIDRTFTTDGAADAPRFFEQVSPVDKGGSDVNGLRGFWASADGETLMYQYKTAPSEGEAGVVSPRSSAWRGPDGWDSTPLDAPQLPGPAVIANPVLTFVGGISDDGTKATTVSMKALAPGAVEGQSNLYVRDTRTGAYETMATAPGISLMGDVAGLGRQPFFDGTPDYSHILIKPTESILVEGAPFAALYEWTEDEGVRIASVDENGNPLGFILGGGGPSEKRDINYLSDDGSKLFFTSLEEPFTTYVRIDGEKSVKIGGYFAGATNDGRWAFVSGTNLTPDSPADVMSLYRFDTEAGEDGELELLTELAGNTPSEAVLQITPDGSSIFFGGERALVPEAEHGNMNLYVWHAGEVQLIASIPNEGNRPQEYMASPSGRWFAFTSWSNLTEYDTRSKTACTEFRRGDPEGPNGEGVACKQVYRYNVETEELLCASCPPDLSPPTGGARMGPENVEGDFNFPRAMLDDGTVIFDTPEPLSAEDSNSNRDVYTFDGSDTTLISGGRTASRSEFDEASADGSSIFFTTQDQLVRQDKDTLADVYVSRINGGIAAQNPPPPRPECIRDDCKETPNAGPEMPFGGSEALSGPGNVKPKKAGKRCGKGRQVRKVKGKSRCVKKPGKAKKQKRANSNRRQGR